MRESEFQVGDVVSEIGIPDKWVVMGYKQISGTYFVCEIEDGERYANVLQLDPEVSKRLMKVGLWDFSMNCEVEDEN